jgi:putative copper resistance protein D
MRSGSAAAALKVSLMACGLAFALVLWTQAAVMAEVPLLVALGSIGSVLGDSHIGHAWLAGTAALAMLAGMGDLSKAGLRRSRLVAATGCGVLFAASKSWTSHAGASGELVPFVVDWVHLVSASVWAGAVFLATVLVLREPRPIGMADREACAAFVEALSATATWSLAGVLATGAFNAWRGLGGSLGSLWASGYGQLLLAKLVLVAIAIALGAHNRFRVMPSLLGELRSTRSTSHALTRVFHRVLCLESFVLLAVLAAAAALSNSAPPSSV